MQPETGSIRSRSLQNSLWNRLVAHSTVLPRAEGVTGALRKEFQNRTIPQNLKDSGRLFPPSKYVARAYVHLAAREINMAPIYERTQHRH